MLSRRFPTARIEEAASATTYASALARGGFDVVVAEFELPWADGPALLRSINESRPGIPVVFLSRHADTERAVATMRAGAADYLVKGSRSFVRLPTAVGDAVVSARAWAAHVDTLEKVEHVGSESQHLQRLLSDAARDLAAFADAASHGGGHDGGQTASPKPPADLTARFEPNTEGTTASPAAPAGRTNRLEQINGELRELIAQTVHELDAPLRTVAQHARMLRESAGGLSDEARLSLNLALAGVGRMQDLLDDLQAYSRLEAENLSYKSCDCNQLVDRIWRQLQTRLGAAGANSQLSKTNLPTVFAEPSQLTQVFENLLSNAVKFQTETPARVEISARAVGAEWLFSVRDHGIGIERGLADSIFTLFKRLRPEYPGTGVGLAICKRVVERHGGRIWVESRAGDGSTFHFTLPRDPTRVTP